MTNDFQQFLETHPTYKTAYERLRQNSGPDRAGRVLAASAQLVYRTQGEALGPVADELLAFIGHAYAPGYMDRYLERISYLAGLQRRFDQHPCRETLGDAAAMVDERDYSLALLLSIVFTNHRFEIMAQLSGFLKSLARQQSEGSLVSIGVGTGYELVNAARLLPGWTIEAYDTNDAMRCRARQLWKFFATQGVKDLGAQFPLEHLDESLAGHYDAIVMCELCEHLPDPLRALMNVREYLKEGGCAFVTMAINLAQEDHIYLYPTIQACRDQLCASGLHTVSEWIAPQAGLAVPTKREEAFQKGNYVAVVRKHAGDDSTSTIYGWT